MFLYLGGEIDYNVEGESYIGDKKRLGGKINYNVKGKSYGQDTAQPEA